MNRGLRDRLPAEAVGEFSSPKLTFNADRSTCVLLQWKVKDPGHSFKSEGGSIKLNKQRSRSGLTVLSRHSVRTCQGFELTHYSQQSFLQPSFVTLMVRGRTHKNVDLVREAHTGIDSSLICSTVLQVGGTDRL